MNPDVDVTCVAVANPGYGGRTALRRRRRPLDARVAPVDGTSAQPRWCPLASRAVERSCRPDLHTDSQRQHKWRLVVLAAAGIPRGGRVRPCRAHREAGNRPQRFIRASSVIAFWLHRVSADVLSRGADVVASEFLDARGPW